MTVEVREPSAGPADAPASDAAASGARGPSDRGVAQPVQAAFLGVVVGAVVAGLATAVTTGLVVGPLGAATVDPDATASVLYFERLVAGQRLEAFVPTTPKPLLTLLYGLTWTVTHDWRVLTWLAIAAVGIAAALAAVVVLRFGVEGSDRSDASEATVGRARPGRTVGAWAGATFLTTTLATWSALALEVSRANSLVVSLACWAAAAVALGGRRRRPVIGGLALLLAGLARFETLALVGALIGVAALLAVGEGIARRRLLPRGFRWRRSEVLIVAGLGLLAVPIACAHDALLTGDPLFWVGVPARYTALYAPGVVPVPLGTALGMLADRLLAEWVLVVLALAGLVALSVRRTLVPLVGLAALWAGMSLLVTGLAVRGVYLSARYYEPLEVAILGLAAFGVAGLVEAGVGGLAAVLDALGVRRQPPRAGGTGLPLATVAAGLAVGLAVGLGATSPTSFADPAVATTLAAVRRGSADLAAAMPRLVALTARGGEGAVAGLPGTPQADPSGVRLFVPSTLRSRVVVETGASLADVGDTLAASLASPAWRGLHAGQWLYHDPAVDRPAALARLLETDPARLGGALARPVAVDASTGVRYLRVTAP